MRDSVGKITGLVGLTRDITERKLAEEALQKSEALYRNLVLRLPDGVYKSTHDGKFVDVNPAIVNMLGYDSKEELMAIDIKAQLYLEPSDRESLLLQEKLEEMGIYQLKKKDGCAIWVEDHGWYNLDENGNILSHEGIMRDITDRKQIEEELARQQYLMSTLMDSLPDHIYFKDLESRFVRVNKSLALTFGLDDPANAIGKSDSNFYSEEHSQQAYEDEQKIILTGQPLIIEEKETYKDHPDTWASTIKMPLFDKEGKIKGTFGISRDITKQQLIQQEIKLKNEELKKLNVEKDKFFSIIAHDLRSPFNGFLGLTQIMDEDLRTLTMDEIQDIAKSLRSSANNLFRLLENLLEWAKLQQGLIPFKPKVVKLLPIVDDCISIMLELAKNKGIELVNHIPENLTVFADTNIFQTVIRNLVSNAVKFTPKGGKISLSSKVIDEKNVEISIMDTGIGMSQQMVENLFRLDVPTSRIGTEGEPSSGLGLFLCKEFIEKHGGKLWVESKVGKGSIFSFTISALGES